MSGTRPGERNPRLVTVGILLIAAGGIVLAITFIATLPTSAVAGAAALFLAGIIVVGVGGGLKTAWEVVKALLP
jgi:hypothetical protein